MKQWYALRSKPKKELTAAAMLSRASIQTYVPLAPVYSPWSRQPGATPFFPGYLFGQLDPSAGEIQMARYTSGVLDVVGYGGEPWPVPDELIESIRQRIERLHARKGAPDFNRGDKVVIQSGPFRGVEAVFDSHLSAGGRVKVLISLLRRLCPAELQIGQLRLTK